MNDAGTLQEVRAFIALCDDVRRRCGRAVTFILIHHENKGGKVSGAWEGAGDTLLHVTGMGNGRTRIHVQKARWATNWHARTLELRWTDGEGFEVDEKPELSDDDIAERIVAVIGENPGTGWRKVEDAITGVRNDRKRTIRDRLLSDGGSSTSSKTTGSRSPSTTAPNGVRAGSTSPTTQPSRICARPGHRRGTDCARWGARRKCVCAPVPRT